MSAPLPLPLIDCHAHLYAPSFERADVVRLADEAEAVGVSAIVVVPESLDDAREVLQQARRDARLAPCAGLHPVQPVRSGDGSAPARCVALDDLPPALDFIRANAAELVAVGEVGLDFTPHVIGTDARAADEAKRAQREVFAAQIAAAAELGLPLNVHSRSAGHHALELVLERRPDARALFHAFDGRAAYALR